MRDQEKRVFDVRFADETKKEFRKLGPSASSDILSAVQKKLTENPTGYGEPLARELVGYRKLPVGQWRVVYCVEETKVLVLVPAVGKRAMVTTRTSTTWSRRMISRADGRLSSAASWKRKRSVGISVPRRVSYLNSSEAGERDHPAPASFTSVLSWRPGAHATSIRSAESR
ncbi:MAG TPA: type II toxin-antitoxin system RelE/ParE family toxin, partial [Longimicrobium sp.]|nr:type II toxin-antitoxin system RelE/ParE family toxin [Longimicrobium sp.]